MKVNTCAQLVGIIDKKPLEDRQQKLTFRTVCVNALCLTSAEEKVDGVEKFARYKLAEKISENDEIKLSADDIVLLKKVVGTFYSPLIVGQIYKILGEE